MFLYNFVEISNTQGLYSIVLKTKERFLVNECEDKYSLW
jgi:hypothetical protein